MRQILLLLLAATGALGCATARGTVQPAVDERPRPGDKVVFHEVEFDVAAERGEFVRAFLGAPLQRFIKGTEALPGVSHTTPLTASQFPEVGSVRLVVLRDGETAHEEVLASDEGRLHYLVTQYTSAAARPIAWGRGEFTFTPAGARTHVTWRYTFKLREDRFPGSLGGLGRTLFRSSFLKSDYAEFMDAQVREIQAFASSEVAQ